MTYYTYDEALNNIELNKEQVKTVTVGFIDSCRYLSNKIIEKIKSEKKNCIVAIDGFIGIEWDSIIYTIKKSLVDSDLNVRTVDIRQYYKPNNVIEDMVSPYLKSDKSFGVVYKGKLKDFLDIDRFEQLKEEIKKSRKNYQSSNLSDVLIVYGYGALQPSLRNLYDIVLYLDITLDDLLKLFEKKAAFPIGCNSTDSAKELISKRFTYIDYKILNMHKKYVLNYIDYYGLGNETNGLVILPRKTYEHVMETLSSQPLRLQPFYIHRVWGGKYINKIRNIPLPACAFSMEVYVPLQNIRISFDDIILKIPFLNVLWNCPVEILGPDSIRKFGIYFPLTANYDDTFKGGSLAIQVHPYGKYMKEKFNEKLRHDETYYVVKAWSGARTYLGLKEEADLDELLDVSIMAEKNMTPYDHNKYINSFESKVGDLFLIPSGTIHASGENQLILELDFDGSKVGAEYTFHIYDFLRLDINGKLRSIHLEHAFNVIRPFIRTGWVKKHLKQQPQLLRKGKNWAEYVLGKRKEMYYQVNRLEFQKDILDTTNGRFHLLTLVEGESAAVLSIEFPERKYVFKYTESVVIPACLGSYKIVNLGKSPCKVIKSFLK